jgi:hypothetical protein
MLTITLATLKADITPDLKGTSLRQVKDFYATAAGAANRMLARIDPEETRRTQTLSTPFYDDVNDYAMADDYKRMIDIRPTANRQDQPGLSDFSQTTPRQFSERLTPNSFSIGWNNMLRTLRAQRLPAGNVVTMDSFESATGNGSWSANVDASGLYTENLNYVEGNAALGFNLSGSTGAANLLNTTAAVVDLSALRYNDASMLRLYIPSGFSSRFTSFKLLRGESASAYREATVTTQADGTAFKDGWNFLIFNWATATVQGSPTNLLNSYRRFSMTYSAGTAIPGVLVDAWTDALGNLYEMEYYSEYMFRTAGGVWIARPTADTDLVNVGPASYEILKAEMMIDITKQIRTGTVQRAELEDWRMMLNGQPPNRYVREPQYRGLYSDYMNKFPSTAIVTSTNTYEFDV